MPTFTVGKPITTKTPTISVDAGLAVGSHRFQLEVIDDAGNRSVPAVAVVAVQREVITGPLDPRPTIPGSGPVVDPVLTGPRPTVVSPTVVSPTVVSPTAVSPTVVSPTTVSPTVISPSVVRPTVVRPAVVTPRRPKPTPGSKGSKPK